MFTIPSSAAFAGRARHSVAAETSNAYRPSQDCPRNSAGDGTDKSGEQHERPRRRYAKGHAIEQLAVRLPVILRNRAALHEDKRSVGASETEQPCFQK